MRLYLLERNLRADPDFGPFWHPIPLHEIQNFNLDRGRYITLVPGPTAKPAGILYAFRNPSDHPDRERKVTTVDLVKGKKLVPVSLFVKDATRMFRIEEEVVRLFDLLLETSGVGMDPDDITKAFYGRAVLDFVAITAAKSVPAPTDTNKAYRKAPEPQVYTHKWPKCLLDIFECNRLKRPWSANARTGPPPTLPGAPGPSKPIINGFGEVSRGAFIEAAKSKADKEKAEKAEKAKRKQQKAEIKFQPHPSFAPAIRSPQQATLSDITLRHRPALPPRDDPPSAEELYDDDDPSTEAPKITAPSTSLAPLSMSQSYRNYNLQRRRRSPAVSGPATEDHGQCEPSSDLGLSDIIQWSTSPESSRVLNTLPNSQRVPAPSTSSRHHQTEKKRGSSFQSHRSVPLPLHHTPKNNNTHAKNHDPRQHPSTPIHIVISSDGSSPWTDPVGHSTNAPASRKATASIQSGTRKNKPAVNLLHSMQKPSGRVASSASTGPPISSGRQSRVRPAAPLAEIQPKSQKATRGLSSSIQSKMETPSKKRKR